MKDYDFNHLRSSIRSLTWNNKMFKARPWADRGYEWISASESRIPRPIFTRHSLISALSFDPFELIHLKLVHFGQKIFGFELFRRFRLLLIAMKIPLSQMTNLKYLLALKGMKYSVMTTVYISRWR